MIIAPKENYIANYYVDSQKNIWYNFSSERLVALSS